MPIPTKTIQIDGIACKERKTFFYNLKKYVFQCVIENQEAFFKNGLLNQYIHESIQQKQARDAYNKSVKNKINQKDRTEVQYKLQQPLYVQSLIKNKLFTLNAFGEKGVASLELWLQLFKTKTDINTSALTISTQETTVKIEPTQPNRIYKSENWIPFRLCKNKNGFYYNLDKTPQKLADFEARLKKNLETFILNTCEQELFKLDSLWLAITNLEALGEQLALNNQKKQVFKVEFECNYNLPDLFSLGQNVAYGNGVFIKHL
ncbi:hypothetical protein [Flavivirga jejuensis]|uniref:Uncharacterized protein n=1 Tax=Flavivirga jejuensis TaxID=870487 RepID=A0ABT8WVP6_9FLAO|nr:hypothetical protein [Flavivirga jejuensis]MDO5976947.1 hypothetical protein [Flavivirga jejuensis]